MKTKTLTSFDWSLWLISIFIIAIPTLQNIIRIHFIGQLPNDWGLNIASQVQWLNIFYEVIQEMFLVPLFYLFHRSAQWNNLVTGFWLVFVAYLLLAAVVIGFTEQILLGVQLQPDLIPQTSAYIRWETLAKTLAIGVDYFVIYLLFKKDYQSLIGFTLIKTILLIGTDYFLISSSLVSLNLGVMGIAYANIITSLVITIYLGYRLLKTTQLQEFSSKKFTLDLHWIRTWLSKGVLSGLESFIRNAVFVVMILGMVNKTGEAGTYWTVNSLIWGVLLVPGLALANVVQADIANDPATLVRKTRTYLGIGILCVGIWLLGLVGLEWFLTQVMQMSNVDKITSVIYLQTAFYWVFVFNNSVLDATLKAMGYMKYMLYQSFCIDIGYYGIVFALYYFGVIEMNLENIALIFGVGMLMDMIPTIYLYNRMLAEHNYNWKMILKG